MERWSHRRYVTALAWLNDQWNKPSRSDHYQMQIAREIRMGNVKDPKTVEMDHFKIPFTMTSGPITETASNMVSHNMPTSPPTPEQIQARGRLSKSIWFNALGLEQPK